MRCTKCLGDQTHKSGIVRGMQQWYCKTCHRRFMESRKSAFRALEVDNMALRVEVRELQNILDANGITYGVQSTDEMF